MTRPGAKVVDPDSLLTPALLIFEHDVDHNIRVACELAGGPENLFTHVKTHKSAAISARLIAAGMRSFKCATLAELDMLIAAGAQRIVLAYPQTQAKKVDRLLERVSGNPDTWIATIAGSAEHVELLADRAGARRVELPVLLDIDTGMHRTGAAIDGDALAVYRHISKSASLTAAGLHYYDGHDCFTTEAERAAAAQRHITALDVFRGTLESEGLPVPLIIGGGAYSFSYYARTAGMYGAPGSFIYWDVRCASDMPDVDLRQAGMILTQVVDRHEILGTFTTDLGTKAICTDQPLHQRTRLVGHDAELILHNEEYAVFRSAELPNIGDYLLAVPWHIGPTTVLYPGAHVIGADGAIRGYIEHTARDRG